MSLKYFKKKSNSKHSTSTNTANPTELTQKDELPGVDYKNKLGPRSLRHNRLDLSTDEGESRFLNSVTKELSKKSNIRNIQTAFQKQDSAQTALASKTIFCTNQEISVKLTSPLNGISLPCYVGKYKNEELIKEFPTTYEEDDDRDKINARPKVLGVNLKWRNGIQVKQLHKFSSRVTQLEPVMRKTDFDYDSKTKFTNQVESVCEELFPDWRHKLMILDANECHGQFTSKESSTENTKIYKSAKSDKLEEDPSVSAPFPPGDPITREWKEYTDLEEHKILVIPSHSKTGFDTTANPSKRYQFPYQAKFVIGKRTYHHRFILQLSLSKSPQHFGLIFSFSQDSKGYSRLRIKSLLTVYSLFPETPKHAILETYACTSEYDTDTSSGSPSPTSSNSRRNQSSRAAKNAVQLLSDNLTEEKLVMSKWDQSFTMERKLPQAGESVSRHQRLYDDTLTGKKQKKKQQILRNIKMEQARC